MPDHNESLSAPSSSPQLPTSGRLFGGSLRNRILLAMAVVALGPLLVMAYQGYQLAQSEIIDQAQMHLQSVLAARRGHLESWLQERRSDLRFLASTPHSSTHCKECAAAPDGCEFDSRLLDIFLERNESYDIIVTYDLMWAPIDMARQTKCPWDASVDNAFAARVAEAEGLVVNTPAMDCQGCICLEMGHPIFDPDKKKIGYLVTCMNVSRAVDPILQDRSGLGETGKVYLVSEGGLVQSQPVAGEKLLGTPAALPPITAEAPPGAVRDYVDFKGNEVLGAQTGFPGMPFTIVAEIDQTEAFRPLAALKLRVLITALVTLAVALLISLRLAGKLSFPLRELASVSRRISQGKHGERLGPMDGAEARDVAAAFNRMLDELSAAQQRLSHAAALAAIGELSTSVVHEVRNPLSSIKVNIQALRNKVAGDRAHSELADIAAKQVDRVERMLNDLLHYGKPLVLNPEPVVFGELVNDVRDVLRDKAESLGVRIAVVDGLGDEPIVVDREHMERALANLLANAIEAADGEVTVIGLRTTGRDGRVSIRVADNGPGIPESIKEKLFQPFVTTRDEGTGLGLANVKKIAEYHGGTVSAANGDRGAVLTISFPAG